MPVLTPKKAEMPVAVRVSWSVDAESVLSSRRWRSPSSSARKVLLLRVEVGRCAMRRERIAESMAVTAAEPIANSRRACACDRYVMHQTWWLFKMHKRVLLTSRSCGKAFPASTKRRNEAAMTRLPMVDTSLGLNCESARRPQTSTMAIPSSSSQKTRVLRISVSLLDSPLALAQARL